MCHDSNRSDSIQLISIEQDLRFQCLRLFTVIPEAVGANGMHYRLDAVVRPAFGGQNLTCKISGCLVMLLPAIGRFDRML